MISSGPSTHKLVALRSCHLNMNKRTPARRDARTTSHPQVSLTRTQCNSQLTSFQKCSGVSQLRTASGSSTCMPWRMTSGITFSQASVKTSGLHNVRAVNPEPFRGAAAAALTSGSGQAGPEQSNNYKCKIEITRGELSTNCIKIIYMTICKL